MYYYLRLLIGGLLFLAIILWSIKSRHPKKKLIFWISSAVTVSLLLVSVFLPFENAFFTFPSAEQAYRYTDTAGNEVQTVIEGKNSAVVLAKNGNTINYLCVPKTEGGWKIGLGYQTQKISQRFPDSGIVTLYRYEGSEDFYVNVLCSVEGEVQIYDNQNSEFHALKQNNLLGTFYTYCASVGTIDSDYELYLNGETVILYN